MSDLVLQPQIRRLSVNTELLREATNSTDHDVMFGAAANFLDSLYPVTRHFRGLNRVTYDTQCRETGAGRAVAGLTWLRGQQVHHFVGLNEFTDKFSDYFYSHFGRWEWVGGLSGNGQITYCAYESDIVGHEVRPTLSLVTEFIAELRKHM